MNYRAQKRIIIVLFTLITVFSLGWGVYLFFSQNGAPPAITGDKEKVKPEDIEVLSEDFFEARGGVYDAMAHIENPNSEYGSSNIAYEFIFKDSAGNVLKSGSGKTFILPDKDRYIVEPAVSISRRPAKVTFLIKDVIWEKLLRISLLDLAARNIELTRTENSTSLTGIVNNGTPYNLQNIEVMAVLSAGKIPISVGQTNMQTMLRGSERFFQIRFPSVLPADLDIDLRVESNFLENSNFIKEFGAPQKF